MAATSASGVPTANDAAPADDATLPTPAGQAMEPGGRDTIPPERVAATERLGEGAGGYGRAEDALFAWSPPPTLPGAHAPLRLAQVHYFVRHGERAPVRERLAHASPPIPTRWNFCHETNRFRLSVLQRHTLPRTSSDPSSATSSPSSPSPGPDQAAQAEAKLYYARADAQLGGPNAPDPASNPFHPAYTSESRSAPPLALRTVESVDRAGKPQEARQGDCLWGELTDVGRASTYAFGARLKRLYVDHLGLVPPLSTLTQVQGDAWIYLRHTNVQRCAESLQNAVAALMEPPPAGEQGIIKGQGQQNQPPSGSAFCPTLRVRNSSDEDLLPNVAACPILRRLLRDFSDRAARRWNPILATYDGTLARHNENRPLRVDSQPRLSGVFDTLNAALAHGLTVPRAFDVMTRRMMERAVVDEWFGGYVTRSERARTRVRMLGLGPLLVRLADELEAKAYRPLPREGTWGPGARGNTDGTAPADGMRLAVYAAHDTTLSALLATLDVYQARWPAFTASLGVELFADDRATERRPTGLALGARRALGLVPPASDAAAPVGARPHYVRLRFGDDPLILPVCARDGQHLVYTDAATGERRRHPELCTLEAFVAALRSIGPRSPEQYAELCELPMEPIHFKQ